MKYSLGLDIGTTSIGWAVIDLDNKRIHDVGVRIFERPEDPQNGKSLAEPRRTARSARRRLKRRRQRLNALKSFFASKQLLSEDEIKNILDTDHDSAYRETHSPYLLREKGLIDKLTNSELFIALYHIAKRRGYHSNSKAQDEEVIKRIESQKEKLQKKQDEGKEITNADEQLRVLSAIHDNKTLLSEHRSIVGVLNNSTKFAEHKRNKANNYQGSFMRDDFHTEARNILNKQIEFGLPLTESDVESLLLGGNAATREDGIIIVENPGIFYQRPFMNSILLNGMRGKDMYNNKDRAPKASLTFEIFRLAEDIAHIKNAKDPGWRISPHQVEAIIAKAKTTKKVTYGAIREVLGFKNNYDEFGFGYIRGKSPDFKKIKNYDDLNPTDKSIAETKEREKATFVQMNFYHDIRDALKNSPESFSQLDNSPETFDKLGEILTINKDDDSKRAGLEKINLSNDVIDSLILLDFAKFGNLSLETMHKAIPLMIAGKTYDKALEQIYPGKFATKLSGDKTKLPPLNEEEQSQITNPVVKRAVSQTIKVVNAIIRKYGLPSRIGIEAAGDLAKDFGERNKIKRAQDDNAANNEKLKQRLTSEFGVVNPTGLQITKFKMYQQQNGKCMYSGRPLDLVRLFSDEHYGEIDHIIPFSRCGNDSLSNKVLVLNSENQDKGDLTPYEAWGNNGTKWAEFEARIKATFMPFSKKDRLLAKTPPTEEWNIRALNDTRYISKFLRRYFRENLKFDNDSGAQRVITPTGLITSYLRRVWQVGGKVRDDNLHHATDACIIASVSQGAIQKVSSLNKYYELFRGNDKNEITDKLTGEIIRRGDVEQHIADVSPWEDFGKEVRLRTGEYRSPKELQNGLIGLRNYDDNFRESVRPIFVSRMPKRSGKGSTNQETIRSPKIVEGYEDKNGNSIIARRQRVALSNLKLKDLYDSPIRETDVKLYELLRERLENNGDDPKKAFAEPVYKPTKSGEHGNIVRSVKVYDTLKSKTGFYINDGKAFVNNGSMARLDVYQKSNSKGKIEHFFVPIYTHQINLEKTGQKITKIMPEPKGFTDVDDSFTKVTSLFPNDYVRIYFSSSISEGYYRAYDVAAGPMSLLPQSASDAKSTIRYSARSAISIEKMDISVLGDNYKWI